MSLPRLPYLQNAVAGYYSETGRLSTYDHRRYTKWLMDQGVNVPIGIGVSDIDKVRIEFTDEESELMFLLRWA
jgi:phage terminase Nu1 subunit (DNA packaging protein)